MRRIASSPLERSPPGMHRVMKIEEGVGGAGSWEERMARAQESIVIDLEANIE
jgi:hypothetical protein